MRKARFELATREQMRLSALPCSTN